MSIFACNQSLTPSQLAHIKEMNHSYAFKAVNTQIRKELAALRAKKYYGDGFWSTGRVLTSGRQDVPFAPHEQPIYTWFILSSPLLLRKLIAARSQWRSLQASPSSSRSHERYR